MNAGQDRIELRVSDDDSENYAACIRLLNELESSLTPEKRSAMRQRILALLSGMIQNDEIDAREGVAQNSSLPFANPPLEPSEPSEPAMGPTEGK